MAKGIPSVKVWRAVFANGAEIEVRAPTRMLAKLEIRRLGFWAPIRSIAILRNGSII